MYEAHTSSYLSVCYLDTGVDPKKSTLVFQVKSVCFISVQLTSSWIQME